MSTSDQPAGDIPPILLVGCGRMGGAMLSGWRERGLAPSVAVDPAPEAARLAGPDLAVVADPSLIPADFSPAAVVLAVKPQTAAEALPPYAPVRRQGGVPVDHGRPHHRRHARPAGRPRRDRPGHAQHARSGAPGRDGGLRRRRACRSRSSALCERLLQAIGVVAWADDEALLDPVTAVSGSGPAYVFLLAELLEQAAVEQGMPADLARVLARQTVAGSGALLAASAEDAAALRRAVTSPAGTTEAALKVLMAPEAWPAALSRAMAAATGRSRELAG